MDRIVPPLDGWVTTVEIAGMLGVSKQAVHKMIFERNAFNSLCAVGDRPVYVARRSEVESIMESNRKANR